MTAPKLLFILRSPPDAQGHSLGMDTALAAAAMEQEVIVLLAFPGAAEALRQAAAGEDSPLQLLRAADLFGLQQVRLLAEEPELCQDLAGLPIAVGAIAPQQMRAFIGECTRVFSYP